MKNTNISSISPRFAYALKTADDPTKQPLFESHKDQQVREDKGFYIPDLLSDEQHDLNAEAYAAAKQDAEQLIQAWYLVGDARNLVGLTRVSLGDEHDSRAMQIDTVLRVIEKKLKDAYNGVDQHDRHYRNLFLAYFDLRDKSDDESEN